MATKPVTITETWKLAEFVEWVTQFVPPYAEAGGRLCVTFGLQVLDHFKP